MFNLFKEYYIMSEAKIPRGVGVPALLPPCRVCGGKPVGKHYGVVSCQRCRSFFGRMLSSPVELKCTKSPTCLTQKTKEINNTKRSGKIQNSTRLTKRLCVPCRYQTCLEAGMTKVKKCGRYSHADRTGYTVEVQRLHLQKEVVSPAEGNIISQKEREKELDDIVEQLRQAHLNTAPNDLNFFATINQRETRYKEDTELKTAMFGPMKPLPYEDFVKIYKSTGYDIDGRTALLKKMIPGIERFVKRLISFIKQIPGFNKLPPDDQVKLVKGSIFESDIISSYPIYNNELPAFIDPDNPHITMSYFEFSMFYDYNKLHLFADCAECLRQLDLLPEEQAVLYAYMVLTSDCTLSPEGQRIITALRDTIEECMIRIINLHHDDPNVFLAKLVTIIANLKNVQQQWITEYGGVVKNYSYVNWPPIVQQMFLNDHQLS